MLPHRHDGWRTVTARTNPETGEGTGYPTGPEGRSAEETEAEREWLMAHVPGLAEMYRTAQPATIFSAYVVFKAGEEAEDEARARGVDR